MPLRMYKESLSHDGHTRRFSVDRRSGSRGWEIRHEEDDRLITSVVCDDWHRVERARNAFAAEAMALRSRGWTDSEPS
jgi:hypothetical protein